MSLSHALLTSLIERPSSGYDLARRFDKSIGYFWHATHQQIYRELGRMEQAGWVASEGTGPETATGRTRKRVYSVLPQGRQELQRWVREPAEPPTPRDDLLVRLRAEAQVGPTGLDGEIERRLQGHEARLRAYRAIEQRDFGPSQAQSRERALQHLVLKTGIMYEQGWAAWCREALDVLRQA